MALMHADFDASAGTCGGCNRYRNFMALMRPCRAHVERFWNACDLFSNGRVSE